MGLSLSLSLINSEGRLGLEAGEGAGKSELLCSGGEKSQLLTGQIPAPADSSPALNSCVRQELMEAE